MGHLVRPRRSDSDSKKGWNNPDTHGVAAQVVQYLGQLRGHSVCVCASDRASLEITMPHRSIQTLGFEKVGEAQSTENFFHIESYDFGTCLRKSSMLHCHPHWSPCDALGTPSETWSPSRSSTAGCPAQATSPLASCGTTYFYFLGWRATS